MHFGSPLYFWLLPAIPALVGFFIWAYQRKQEMLRRFASLELIARLTPSARLGRQVLRWTILLAAVFFLVLALTRPRFGLRMEMVERKGVDIVVALDVSESMLAEDITPNRIDRAKHEVAKLIDMLKGDRFGLIVFAGESFVQCPLTLDYGAAKMFLDAVNTDWINLQGTALAEAIDRCAETFVTKAKKSKVLILITDGENHEGDAVESARKAAAQGVKIYTIGIGSENGVPIPLKRTGGNVVYKKDKDGNLVMTRLDQDILASIAREGDGQYFRAGTNLDLAAIYQEIMTMEKGDLGLNRMSVYEEQYQVFLAIALVLLLVEFFTPERVRRKEEWKGRG